jgi:hypothetical protein
MTSCLVVRTGRVAAAGIFLNERLQSRYGRPQRLYYPQFPDVEDWVEKQSINDFRHSMVKRQNRCSVRKGELRERGLCPHHSPPVPRAS